MDLCYFHISLHRMNLIHEAVKLRDPRLCSHNWLNVCLNVNFLSAVSSRLSELQVKGRASNECLCCDA